MDNKKFGEFIVALRKEKGWTQNDLAAHLNVTDKAVSKWERGVGFPDIKIIEPLAETLGVSVLEIMRSEKNEESDVSMENATEAIGNVIDVVEYQRKVERRNIIIISAIITVLIMTVFIMDTLQLLGLMFVVLPFILFAVGVFLVSYSIHLKRQKNPYKLTLIIGILSLLYPVAVFLLFFFAFAIGGPVTN